MFRCKVCGEPTEYMDSVAQVPLCSNQCTDRYFYGPPDDTVLNTDSDIWGTEYQYY